MKPERTRGGRSALAAARTALRAELGWLRGLPTAAPRDGALAWRVVPHPGTRAAPEDQVVDRERLRAATHALATLPRRFPRALPRVVGDVPAWVDRAQALLHELSAAVHRRRPLQPRALARPARPGLASLVEALAWVHALDPSRLEAARRVVDAQGEALEVLVARGGDALAVQLLDLVVDDPRGPGLRVVHLLGREALWTTSLTADPGDLDRLAAAIDCQSPAPRWRPPARATPAGQTVLALVRSALAQDGGARDRVLETLVAVLPGELIEAWASWWREVDACAGRVRRRVLGAEPCDACARTEAEALRALARRRLPSVRPPAVRDVAGHAMDLTPAVSERLVEVLRALDPLAARSLREPARLELAGFVVFEPRHAGLAVDLFARLVRAAPGALGANAATLAAWIVDRRRDLDGRGPALSQALIDLARDGRLAGLDHARWSLLVEHLKRTGDAAGALALVRAADGLELPWRLDEAVSLLCAGEPGRLAGVVRGLGKDDWLFAHARALVELARRDDLRPLLVEALERGEGWRVRRLVVRASLVSGLLGARAIAELAAPDVASSPSEVDPARWRREVEALERLAPAAPGPRAGWMRARAARLRARLAGDDAASPRRRRAAERRRARRVMRQALDAWALALEACGAHGLKAWLGQPLPAEWLDDPRRVHVLAALADLPERPLRDLAARVLRARLGPRPWDLRDAPANAAFVERLRARGVDPAPWLDSTERRAWTAQGRELVLALEDDPLEVLRMGEPFRTCLAPGDCNFFAALVDAADVNKRVLYARDAQGTIVGRCLLALTGEGAILTYHPYCHDAALGVAEQVRAFVQDLARAMGTRVVSAGEVPRLLTSEWYCDPPEDVVGAWAAAERELRAALPTTAPDEVPALLERTLGDALDGAALERVIDLPEAEERPELAPGFAPLVAALRPSPRARVVLVERLVRAKAHDAARALARGVRVEQLHALDAASLARALLDLGRAHVAHDVLRRTAPRGQEVAPERHEAWGLVCEALHRRAAALEHYARGADARVATPARDRCRERLAALRAAGGLARAG